MSAHEKPVDWSSALNANVARRWGLSILAMVVFVLGGRSLNLAVTFLTAPTATVHAR